MSQIKVTISHTLKESSSSLSILSISNSVLKKLKIPTAYPLQFRFSNRTQQVVCKSIQTSVSTIQVDTQTAKTLLIPDQCRLYISYHPELREIRIAPIFAILVTQVSKTYPPFGRLNGFCSELIRVAQQRHILAFVVTLKEMLKENVDSVSGWIYLNNKWIKEEFPCPQVIYNRVGSRKMENTNAFITFKQQLARKKIHLFNQTFLDKWNVHATLMDSKAISPFLPHTQLFEGPLTLKQMIEQHPTLFIKPIHGSLGRGIYRLKRTSYGIQSQYTTLNGQIHKHFDKLSSLYSYLIKRIKPSKYIIQQGIPILHYQERAVDFRALMQKNTKGEWAVTSMVARIGPANRFVSNIARGGELGKVTAILTKCMVPDPKTTRLRLLAVAKKVCEELEAKKAGQFGELGVDLALTNSGKIYLLEINSKPSKTEDTLASVSNKGRPSVHRLLDYTLFLSNISTN